MKDATLNDGTTMTDAEFIEEFGMGDAPTDFVATKDDLVSLAHGIVEDLLDAEFLLKLQGSYTEILRRNYIENRLTRLTNYMPELKDYVFDVLERLHRGREQNEADGKKAEAQCAREARSRR
jgi:uncharacterized protein YutD